MFSELLGQTYFYFLSFVLSVWIISEIVIFYHAYRSKKSFYHPLSGTIVIISYLLTFAFTLYGTSNQVGIFAFGFMKWAGACIILLGIFIRILFTMKTSYLLVNNINFVKVGRYSQIQGKGIFKMVRFPHYTGSFLIAWGLGLSFNNIISLFYTFIIITFSLLYRMHIEEEYRKKWFGIPYSDYQNQTKRVFPFIF